MKREFAQSFLANNPCAPKVIVTAHYYDRCDTVQSDSWAAVLSRLAAAAMIWSLGMRRKPNYSGSFFLFFFFLVDPISPFEI